MVSARILGPMIFAVLTLAGGTGCPPPASGTSGAEAGPAQVAMCRHAGDTCDFAPGKIGVCTEPVEGCAGVPSCYVCTSLH